MMISTALHRGAGLALILFTMHAPPARADAPADGSIGSTSSAALAARLATLSQSVLLDKPDVDRAKCSSALLKLAVRLEPTEPRYARLLTERLGQLLNEPNALDDAIAACSLWRKLQPADRQAQLQTIVLFAAQQQTLEKKVEYLKGLLATNAIAPEARSFAAAYCATLLFERNQDESLAMVQKALELNPLNIDALKFRRQFQYADPKTTPEDRLAVSLAMLRANPALAQLTFEVAGDLSAAGLGEESLRWYTATLNIAARFGELPAEGIVRYATQAYFLGQYQRAQSSMDELLQKHPDHYTALILRIMIARQSKDAAADARLVNQARNSLLNQLQTVRSTLGVATATTQPVDGAEVELPDLSGDAGLLVQNDKEDVRQAYYGTLGELAWFDIYFANRQPEAARLVTHYTGLRAEGDPLAARLEGWRLLRDGSLDGARVKLSAISDKDPLALLGLVMIAYKGNREDQSRADADAIRLLSARLPGLLGLVIHDALKERHLSVPPSPHAAGLRAQVNEFPSELFKAIDAPQNFYAIRGEPLKQAVAYAEPLMARVTIANVSDYDIVLGAGGMIQSEFAIDAGLPQVNIQNLPQPLPSVAVGRFTSQLVLHPRQSTSQVVQLDEGILGRVLLQVPQPVLTVQPQIRTDPATAPGGRPACMPGGYSIGFVRAFQRNGFDMSRGLQPVAATLEGDEGAAKIYALELLGQYARMAGTARARAGDDGPKADPAPFLDLIRTSMQNSDTIVASWARYQYIQAVSDDQTQIAFQQLLRDEHWQARAIGLLSMSQMPPKDQQEMARAIANREQDADLRQLSAALGEIAAHAATQPSTAPADEPQVAPVAEPSSGPAR